MDLIKHLENHLGLIKNSWKLKNHKCNIQVLSFKNQPFENTVTYTTLGLSNEELLLNKSKKVRQELIFTTKNGMYEEEAIASFLLTVSEHIIKKGKGVLRGELISLGEKLFEGTNSNSIYCTLPVFFEDSFSVLENTTPKTVFVWLIPLLESDAFFIKKNGWDTFEKILEKIENVDVFWEADTQLITNTVIE